MGKLMGGRSSTRRSGGRRGRARLLALYALSAGGCLWLTLAQPAQAQSARECLRDSIAFDRRDAEIVADACRRAADSSDSRSKAASGYLNAGRAYMDASASHLEAANRDAALRTLSAAADTLESAVRNARTQATIDAANLLLARAYRLIAVHGVNQSARFADAERVLIEIVQSRPGQPNAAALFERAMLVRDRDGAAGRAAALEHLRVFARPDLDRVEDRALVAAGRAELFKAANELGVATLAETPITREGTQRAITSFSLAASVADLAQTAAMQAEAAKAYVNLGEAQLRLAGLNGPGATASFGCAAGKAATEGVDAALASFRAALARTNASPEAFYGAGCALQARNNSGEAVPLLREAARLAPNVSGYQLALARALGRDRWADAEPIYRQALALEAQNPAMRAAIHVEIADVLTEKGRVDDALASLNAAIAADRDYKEAFLRRGKLLFEARADYLQAAEDFRQAERGNRSPAERAEALFYLSRIEVRKELSWRQTRTPPQGDATLAINRADEAVSLNEVDAREAEYRGQACLARVYFGRVNSSGDSRYCSSDERRTPASLLYEGMFHLRRTFVTRGGDQSREWEAALNAFTDGVERMAPARADESLESRQLRSRLQVGRGVALFCVGLESLGREAINAAALRSDAEQFYADYGIKLCAPRG